MRLSEHNILLVVPFLRFDPPAFRVLQMDRVLWPQEVRNRIPLLVGCDRDDAVQAAAEEFAAEEPQ